MNRNTKRWRNEKGIPEDLPVGYCKVWADRLPEIKEMMLNRVTMKNIAKHFNSNIGAFTSAMKYYEISPVRLRHYHSIEKA